MAIDFIRGKRYRMPVFFGPIAGPRQWPKSHLFDPEAQLTTRAGISFLTSAAQLEAFLPEGFALWGEPVVTLDLMYMKNIAWLAGRGYNVSDFKFPAVFNGKDGPVHGTFVLVRWESLTDPILTGRDELGHNKLFCEIPELTLFGGKRQTRLSWLGTNFAEIEFWNLKDAAPPPPNPLNKGQLSFKYIPRTGEPGVADAAYTTLSPEGAGPGMANLIKYQTGQGRFDYRRLEWEEFPFAYNAINAIADLEKREFRGAFYAESRGSIPFPGDDTYIVP
jgi:hypothetical protein